MPPPLWAAAFAAAGAIVGLLCGAWLARRSGRRTAPAAMAAGDGDAGPLPAVATRLIDVRDRLLAAGTGEGAAQSVAWAYQRLGSALADVGVESLDAGGAVDWSVHEAVGTRPAPEEALDQTVASTVRPGYRYRAALLRPQQIILYVRDSSPQT